MTLDDVLAFVRSLPTKAEHYYAGILNSKAEKSIGVYQLGERRARDIAIGGLPSTRIAVKGISILVHWNESTRESDNIAAKLYADIAAADTPTIGGRKVDYINILHNEPIDVGTDNNGICERVIELIIYYERS